MVLSDRTIKEKLGQGRSIIDALDPEDIQTASVDLRLGRKILVFINWGRPHSDDKVGPEDPTEIVEKGDGAPFIFHPGEFVLGSTLEHIELPDGLAAMLEGKRSLGGIGLVVHSAAGFVDPGWKGHLTPELSDLSRLPITLFHGMKIGQVSCLRLTTPADMLHGSEGHGSKYQGQAESTASRFAQEFSSDGRGPG